MECANLRKVPVVVTADHSLQRESMKECQCGIVNVLRSLADQRLSSHLRQYRKGMARTTRKGREIGLREYRYMIDVSALSCMVNALMFSSAGMEFGR
jgi:hypothetical protein